jgi:hypothetical protein
MAGTLLLVALATYLLLCAFLFFYQRQMLYLPQYTQVDAAQTDFELARDEIRLRGWVVNPGRLRALLYFGGNAESVQFQRERYAQWFPDHTVYLLAYRGYGASEGNPAEDLLKDDALALYDQVAQNHAGVDVLGRSVGSGIALHLAARRPIGRLALITPYDSMVAVARRHYPIFPVQWLLRERYEASADATEVDAPTLLLIARHDRIIPPAHAEALARAFPQPPRIQWLESDHNGTEMDARFELALRAHFSGSGLRAAD